MPDLSNVSLSAPQQAAPAPAEAAAFEYPPPFSDVIAGKIPAVTIPPIIGKKTDPLQAWAVENFDEIANGPLEYHETKDNYSVLFNPKLITPEQIDAAAEDGTLLEVAPPAQEVLAAAQQAPAEGAAPLADAGVAPAAPQAAAPLSGVTVPTNKRIQSARLQNEKTLQTKPAAPNPVTARLAQRPM